MTTDKKTEQPQDLSVQEIPKVPSSGRGADSALSELIKRRLPVPQEPLPGGEAEPPSS